MSDQQAGPPPEAPDDHGDREARAARDYRALAHGDRSGTVFDRFFPGPRPADPQVAARLQALADAAERRAANRRASEQRRQRPDDGRTKAVPPTPAASAEDLQKVVDAIHEQTEVLHALLDADVAIRDDSRATAQNSRTFAVAGIAIAFFTLVAAVVTVVISVAH